MSNAQKEQQQANDYENKLKEPEWETLSGKTIDLQKLLAWGVQHAGESDDTTTTTTPDPSTIREQLDTKWVDIIMGRSDAVRMKECMERLLDQDNTLEDRIEASDELELLVEDLDNAQDFVKLNLVALLMPCLKFEQVELRINVLWILGTMVQNSPKIKQFYLDRNIIVHVLDRMRQADEEVAVKSKALFCISGFLKHNNPGISLFAKLHGFEIVSKALMDHFDDDYPFIRKGVFFYHSLITSPLAFDAFSNDESVQEFLVKSVQLFMRKEQEDEDAVMMALTVISHLKLKNAELIALAKENFDRAKSQFSESEVLNALKIVH